MTQKITKVFDKVSRLQKDGYHRLEKTFDLRWSQNPKQLPILQIGNQHRLKNQRCAAQWASPNKKTCIVQSEALALMQADIRPLSYAIAGWTWGRALVHSIPVHFMFETFREHGRNMPHGRLCGLGTGLGFQSRLLKKIKIFTQAAQIAIDQFLVSINFRG
jgi:hypothetical protein